MFSSSVCLKIDRRKSVIRKNVLEPFVLIKAIKVKVL